MNHFHAAICSAPPARSHGVRFRRRGLGRRRRIKLVIGMSLEPPVLDPTKNAAAAIREVTTPSIFESLGRIDRTGAIGPGLAESWSDLRGRQGIRLQAAPGREVP